MSRLNITYTVLSKRKLLHLVDSKYMRGWDDPRMPTIRGLRRRGYSADIINAFCRDIGATRNENHVQIERLYAIARNYLNGTAERVMAVLDPIRVKVSNLPPTLQEITVPNFPQAPERGSHQISVETEIFIDASDFRLVDEKDYYGLAKGKYVGLKYTNGKIRCDEVVMNGQDILYLECTFTTEEENAEKPKGNIQWVPCSKAVPVEVRLYDNLFTVEEPSDERWQAELNPVSEVVKSSAMVDPSILRLKLTHSETVVQFERIGFFVVDQDSDASKLVFNLVVNLKDSKPKVEGAPSRSRKEEQDRQLAEKLARMSLAPQDMFKTQTDLYSAFDADGIPTHTTDGKEISKSAAKKLRKEWEKQKKLYESSKGK